jgi:hypothetical protein
MYSRNCICGNLIYYKSKGAYILANKKNSKCRHCSSKRNFKGNKNPFFNKKHTQETKEIIRNYNIGKKLSNETKLKISKGGKGKNIWSKGKIISDETKLKISKATSGKNNPMYGKPSPQGSGNGWSGWYKGWYFRSLHELSFKVYYIERFKLEWKTGECKEYQIKYNDNNKERNYYPDFLINEKYLVEIKPKKLWNSSYVKLKKEAAIQFCKEKKLKYKLIDPIKILSKNELLEKIKKGELKFIKKYQIKFNNL